MCVCLVCCVSTEDVGHDNAVNPGQAALLIAVSDFLSEPGGLGGVWDNLYRALRHVNQPGGPDA